MRIQLLIAVEDCDYAAHLSGVLAENHADSINVSVCSSPELLPEQLATRKFDVALLDMPMIGEADLQSIHLPLILWSEEDSAQGAPEDIKRIRKYRRISTMVSEVLELYARVMKNECGSYSKKSRITAVWSPAGGVGKTTTALAYAAGKATEGKQVLYLNLEPFSSVRAYFADTGKSISTAFEMLETGEGNIKMLVRGIRQQDSADEIAYFCRPENFDDMNILTPENIAELIDACSEAADELVIDLSSACDERTRVAFDLADKILLVTDSSYTAQIKYSQFASQHNIFQRYKDKASLVANRGAAICESFADTIIYLPLVQSTDAATIYKTLSNINFEA